MFCKTCGKQIDDDSIFCSFCGTKQSNINKPLTDLTEQSEPKTVNVNLSLGRQSASKSIPEATEIKQPKFDPTYTKETDATFLGVVLLLIPLGFAVFGPIKFDSYDSYNQFKVFASLGALVLRIFVTVWVVAIAKRQNRETFGWGAFAFFLPSIALIVIGQQKKYFAKFEINDNLSKEENSQILCDKAVSFLNNKMYNDSIRFAEKAIELDNSNEIAVATLTKARLEVPVNEIANKQTQIVYRKTKDNKILKIVSKKFQTVGAEVFIDDIAAPDGEYAYLNDSRKLIVRNGKIEKMFN
jgi:hypothetical protein